MLQKRLRGMNTEEVHAGSGRCLEMSKQEPQNVGSGRRELGPLVSFPDDMIKCSDKHNLQEKKLV